MSIKIHQTIVITSEDVLLSTVQFQYIQQHYNRQKERKVDYGSDISVLNQESETDTFVVFV